MKNKTIEIDNYEVNMPNIEVSFGYVGKKKSYKSNIDILKFAAFLTDLGKIGTFYNDEECPVMINGEIELQTKTTKMDYTWKDYFTHEDYSTKLVDLQNYLYLHPCKSKLETLINTLHTLLLNRVSAFVHPIFKTN
ncbi:MAG TPA: hypothetical protein PLU58_09485 [Saprospiraceae bacterium]|jgi:hypothetical protein|nr:hypothetical protein [Saprospiraceae bacterium]HQW96022.1 hypothetical protein [Saprospiraceae bacterium]